MKKKLFVIILAIALIFSIAACGQSDNDGDRNTSSNESPGNGDIVITDPSIETDTEENGNTPPDSIESESPNIDNGDNTENPSENGNSDPGSDDTDLDGTPIEILDTLIEKLRDTELWIPMSMPSAAAPAGERQNAIGLSDADYVQYVVTDAQSLAGIATQAHQIIVYQCVDDNAASQVKSLISAADGYDPHKWICVFPEKVIAVEAGHYVLLVASTRDVADAAVDLFSTIVGDVGEVVTIWDGV
jgi:hypothetical protein